ncbi:MFS transporter [Azohydromonas sediminis]|uniref:MFS transporter n=1 Tax=Azohydromonas sediminis TaxID=2259674 RepID=UPI000E65C028|nr:MFS transporter [Azohydromonas sediminis]
MSTAAPAAEPARPETVVAPRRVLPALVVAQLLGTAPWFAVNAVMPELQRELGWSTAAVGTLTSAYQLGFIAGTLVFALLAVADRHSARRVFLLCSLASAACTVGAWAVVRDFDALLVLRLASGFFLAGIYPVGMKLAAQWFPLGLGNALGLLIGALIVGSASAHALRGLGAALPWPSVMLGVAALAATGGVLLWRLLPEPPSTHAAPARPAHFDGGALATLWTDRKVRASVFGYFGHMWELYTMWVLMPLVLATRLDGAALSFAAFGVLGVAGALGCVVGGLLARRIGSAPVAAAWLATSGVCCLLTPWLIDAPAALFALWLAVWGFAVTGDSPQFSALTASNAPRHAMGSVLMLTNCIGFAISIVSIELHVRLASHAPLATVLPWLAVGPLVGLWMLRGLRGAGAAAR